jgi:DNA-binding NtrC family response regulator
VGGEESLESNARVIAATNTDLKSMCEEGLFRKDLYYRLNVFPIEIPPLRERLDDIPHFVEVFLRKMNTFHLKDIRHVDPRVIEAFRGYSWPGNIRELENLMERAYILETSSQLTPTGFPSELFESRPARASTSTDSGLTLAEARRAGVVEIEMAYLRRQLTRHHGSVKDSARAAGITTRQIHKLMKKYAIRKEEFKA